MTNSLFKKTILSATVLISFLLFFKTSFADITANLNAHYKMDETSGTTAADSSGNGNSGAVVGAVWTTGKINGALNFNGTSDYMNVGNSASLAPSNAVTIAGWINSSNPTQANSQTIVNKATNTATNGNYLCRIQGTTGKIRFLINTGAGANLNGNTALSPNVWHHVACVWDGADMRIYLDGVSDATPLAKTGTMANNGVNVNVGRDESTLSQYFNGRIDDVRLYNRALTASDVLQLYNYTGSSSSSSSSQSLTQNPPSVSTNSATSITTSSTILNSTVNPKGQSSNTWFEYGLTSKTGTSCSTNPYGNQTSVQTISGSSNTAVSSTISGLSSNTIYYYRAVANNSSGQTCGTETSFTTLTITPLPPPPPPPPTSGNSESWKSYYGVMSTGKASDHAKYAKQMGYGSIATTPVLQAGGYSNNPNTYGMKFVLSDPQWSSPMYFSNGTDNLPSVGILLPRNVNKTIAYTQAQKDWYLRNMLWYTDTNVESATVPWYKNLTSSGFNTNGVALAWDFQQQRVIDMISDAAVKFAKSYENPANNYYSGGFYIDELNITGILYAVPGYYVLPSSNSNAISAANADSFILLDQVSKSGTDTGVFPVDGNGNPIKDEKGNPITHEHTTYSDGVAAFYKTLNAKMKKNFPNAKWIGEPSRLYNVYNPSQPWTRDEWIWNVSKRIADRDLLTPDLLTEEGPTTEFVDNLKNFTSGMNITKSMVGSQQASAVEEDINRLIAAKAGINGAWFNWSLRFGGARTLPAWQDITQVYPRHKLIRVIPNWDNLNKIPLANRKCDECSKVKVGVNGSTVTIVKVNTSNIIYTPDLIVYDSYDANGNQQSHIDKDVIYSRHPGAISPANKGKLFAVFNTTNGVINLKPGERVAFVRRVDGYFIESTDASSDFVDLSGSQIKLKSNTTIPTDPTNGQVEGTGYIFTIQTSQSSSSSSQSSSSSADATKPVGSITINSNAASTNATNVTLNLSAADNTGVTGYFVSNSSTAPTANQTGWVSVNSATSYSANVSFTLSSGNGTKTVYVWYKDLAGNVSLTYNDAITLNTADTTAPIISNITVSNITYNSATITWTTNENSDSQVEYGLTNTYGQSTTLNTALVTSHSVNLIGLSANTQYHYRVKSHDAALNLATSLDNTFTTAIQTQVSESWKNAYMIAWVDTPSNAMIYAEQMGYDYIAIRGNPSDYKNNPNCAGMKYYIADPYYFQQLYATLPAFLTGKIILNPRNIDVRPYTGNGDTYVSGYGWNYTQAQKNWYNQHMVWKDNTSPWPYNLAYGGSPIGQLTRFTAVWDFQQQAVIDEVINRIMSLFASYEDQSLPFTFAGYMIDIPRIDGYFYRLKSGGGDAMTTLASMTGTGIDSGVSHIGLDQTINKQFATYSDGMAAFYKQLNTRMRQQWPNAKWIIEPARIYNIYNLSQPWTLDEYVWRVSQRPDKDLLTPDFLSEEGASTNFVDDPRNFSSGMNITKSMVNNSNPNKVEEYDNRLIAAKAGINGAWYNWFGRFGGTGNMPSFTSITQVYPRLKLIRVIPNWDNLNGIAVNSAHRDWNNNSTDPVYNSYDANGNQQSHIDKDVMYSRHWKTGKLFAVFNTTLGIINLKPGERVQSVKRVDGYFIESTDAFSDFIDLSGNQIKLKSNTTIPIIPIDPTNGQVEGTGYIFTIQTSQSSSSSSQSSSSSADATKPVGSITINSNAASTNATNVTLNLSATDNTGVTGYFVSNSSTAPTANQTGWVSVNSAASYSANVSFTLSSGNGTKTVYVWYKDLAGNASNIASDSINLNIVDTTAPSISISSPTVNSTYSTTQSTVNISGSASDNTGVTSVTWTNGRGGSGTASGTISWSIANLSLISGSNAITATAKDAANNSFSDTITITYSSTAIPTAVTNAAVNIINNSATLKATVNPNNLSTVTYFEYGLSANSYTQKTPNQTLTGSSNISVAANTGAVLTPNTTYHFRVVAQNSLGTVRGNDQSFTTLQNPDATKPVGSITINGNSASTNATNVTLNLSATDNTGVTGYFVSNSSTAPTANQTGWVSVNSATNYSANVSFTLSSGNGTKTVYVWYKDSSNNISNGSSDTITLAPSDTTKPSGGAFITGNLTATNNPSIVLDLSATDNAGVVGYYISESSVSPAVTQSGWTDITSIAAYSANAPFTLSSGSGTKTIYVFYKDVAGNISDAVSVSIDLNINTGGGGGGSVFNNPPAQFKTIFPSNGDIITEDKPTFNWEDAVDGDLDQYQIYLDGELIQSDIKTVSFTVDVSISCDEHSWFVRAVDQGGNNTDTIPSNFTRDCGGLTSASSSSSSISLDADLSSINPAQSASSYQFPRLLKYGVRGDDVAELQKRLASEAVYNGPVTGYFGLLTREGVKKYQAKNNLPQVGAVGPRTLALLNKTSSVPSSQGFSLSQLVELLISLGVISPEKAELARTALMVIGGR